MIIGIDTRMPTKKKTGVAYMISNLIPEIIKLDPEMRYKLLGLDLDLKDKSIKVYGMPNIIKKAFNFLWKKIFFPPANIITGKIDIFFFTNFVDFPVRAKKRILLIADMSFVKFPQFTEKKNLIFLKKGVIKAINRADKILTISENAKKEICDYYKVESDKVEVIYLGSTKNIIKTNDLDVINKIKAKYGIKGEYILSVGTIEPRKNFKSLIEAYECLDEDIKQNFSLVICGGKGWHYKEIFDIIKEKKLEEKIILTGYADENDISKIYSGASLFAFPSFYEGFGMPVLDAFSCGVPVVCSDNSSLPEVGGDAVIYCNAEDKKSIADSIKKVIADKRLQKELIDKGNKQLEKFSWEKSAKKILDIIYNL